MENFTNRELVDELLRRGVLNELNFSYKQQNFESSLLSPKEVKSYADSMRTRVIAASFRDNNVSEVAEIVGDETVVSGFTYLPIINRI